MTRRGRGAARVLSGLLLAGSVIGFSAEAQSKPLRLELLWNAPDGCPEPAHVLAAIHRLMGATENEGAPELSVRGDIDNTGSTLRLNLVWRTASMQAERTMESRSCDELARAAALIVALAADPSSARQAEEHGGPEASAPTSDEPRSTPPRPLIRSSPAKQATSVRKSPFANLSSTERDHVSSTQASAPSPRESPRVTTRALLGLDVGSLPRPAEGATAGLRFGWGLAAIHADVSAFLPQREAVAEGSAELWLSVLSVRPCLQWLVSGLRVSPCAVAELDLALGRGEGMASRQSGAAFFPRFGGGAEFGYELTSEIAWITNGWLLAGPWRPTFVVEEVVPVHEPSLLVGRWTTGLELRL